MIFITSEKDIKFKIKNYMFFYFYSSWMPMHKKMMTMLSKIEEKYKIQFYAIDTDEFKNLCLHHDVKSIPTILVKRTNKEIRRINGVILTSALKAIFNEVFADIYSIEAAKIAKRKGKQK